MGDDEGYMSEQDIGDILNGTEPTAEAPPVEAAETVETPPEATETEQPEVAAVERPRGPDGKFIPKGEAQTAPPAAQEEPGQIPFAALKDERAKRQAYEAELAELRAQLAQLQQQPAPQAQQEQGPPDRWEDPEGYDRWLVAQATNQATEAAREALVVDRIRLSAEQAKAQHPDYLEKKSVFEQMARHNPMLIEEMKRHPNPAQYAYDVAKTQLELQQYGGLEGLIEARIAARQAEAMQSVQQQLPPSAPPTISGDRSVASRSGPAWAGPTPIGDILS
jgi:hypothetical protein